MTAKPGHDDVVLEIVDGDVARLSDSSYPALSLQTIEFRFTAVDTPIFDGSVRVDIPANWSAPTKDDEKAGKVTVTPLGDTKLKGDAVADYLSFPSGDILVKIMQMPVDSAVKVTYGADGTEKAEVQHNAQDKVTFTGRFQASR